MMVVDERIAIPNAELQFTFVRSSGPGGQNVNKLNTRAVLRWSVVTSPSLPDDVRRRFLARYGSRVTAAGELILSAQRFREQSRNVAECREKLRQMIAAVAIAPRPRKPTRPTRSAVQRRLRGKQLRSAKKRDRRTAAWDE